MKKQFSKLEVKFVWILSVLMSLGLNLNAQDNKFIKFKETVHDFGEIKEGVEQASHEFKFTNVGNTAIKLVDVKPSCGCTTPDWTKDEVAPGKEGIVKATYSTTNRPGPFLKTITVKAQSTDGQEEVHVLKLKGNVILTHKCAQNTNALLNSKSINLKRNTSVLHYPNPFSDKINFKIQLNENETVTFRILDLTGKEVYHKEHQNLSKGEHIFEWRPNPDVSGGLYFYQIKTLKENFSGKINYQK